MWRVLLLNLYSRADHACVCIFATDCNFRCFFEYHLKTGTFNSPTPLHHPNPGHFWYLNLYWGFLRWPKKDYQKWPCKMTEFLLGLVRLAVIILIRSTYKVQFGHLFSVILTSLSLYLIVTFLLSVFPSKNERKLSWS